MTNNDIEKILTIHCVLFISPSISAFFVCPPSCRFSTTRVYLCSSHFSCSFIPFPEFPFPTPSSRSRDKSFRKEQRDKHQNKAFFSKTEKILMRICLNQGNSRGSGWGVLLIDYVSICLFLLALFCTCYMKELPQGFKDLLLSSPRSNIILFFLYSECDRLVNVFF